MSAPYFYDYINASNSQVSPSTVHVHNTGLQMYFRRYLLEKAISVFKWQLPEEWSKDYFLYTLYGFGYIAVLETDKYGVIPQGCGLSGYDVFYRPTTAIITNPLLSGIMEPTIGTQCVLLKLQPDYGGIMDLVNYYADMMALCSEAAGVNLLNSHVSYVFAGQNKAAAESFKKLYDRISSGQPATFVDKELLGADGKPTWQMFDTAVKNSYIVTDVLSDMRKIEAMFDTDVGIPNANTDKRERLITDEVNANNAETISRADLWLEQLKTGCQEVYNMFGVHMSVDWRINPREDGSNAAFNTGSV